ncbi:IS66 family insertion sequence element accessory protein TnpB [Sorangium cellulosum]|uniref:IS66 family insertion sequence element accessory protein TnpB n=1 Tax=Sorangium cellulosum TaxID=56 RepID=UPI0009D6C03C
MLSLPPSVRIFVATQPVDGRKGVDSLAAIVRSALSQDPLSGHLYVFFSRRCDRVRVVYWDRNGFAMWTNHLSSHYTSFGFRRGRWSPLRDARAAAARSLTRSHRLQCFVG